MLERFIMHYRRLITGSLVFVLLLSLTGPLMAASWKRQKAVEYPGKQLLELSGKKRLYYEAKAGESVMMDLTGPAVVHVITRVELSSETAREKYSYTYSIDGKRKEYTVKHKTWKSDVATLKGRGTISESRKERLDIPEGTHRYVFKVPDREKHVAFFRVTLKKRNPMGKAKTVSFTPTDFDETRKVVVKETPWTYYTIGTSDSLTLDVIGPTTMKVISRLNFSKQMMGERSYRIKIFEDDELKNTYLISTKRSQVAYYLNHKEDVPGKGVPFFVSIPRGRHHYRVEFVDGNQKALLNFYLPKKDLDPEHRR